MKEYDKIKALFYLFYWDINDLYGWAMSLKLAVDGFKSIENTSHFN